MAESQPSTPRNIDDTETQTIVLDKIQDEQQQSQPILHLRLQQTRNDHKVTWTADTVDNELMGKKKSKCCCIYEKPKVFGESDSSSSSNDDDDDVNECTPHCRGHKKKCFRHKPQNIDHDGHCDIGAGSENY
uniref:E3 ubiquitin-protein ligase PPP1R11 n=1 Tax=Arion vulgaris TaxID=1028688 RepID=A0A0B7BU92_9EUPU